MEAIAFPLSGEDLFVPDPEDCGPVISVPTAQQ